MSQTFCISCKSATHNVEKCWAELDGNVTVGTIAKVFTEDVSDLAKKCQDAVTNWINSKKAEDDDAWIIVSKKTKQTSSNTVIMCVTCGLPFEYTQQMKKKYEERNWLAPKVCKICSQARYEEKKKLST